MQQKDKCYIEEDAIGVIQNTQQMEEKQLI